MMKTLNLYTVLLCVSFTLTGYGGDKEGSAGYNPQSDPYADLQNSIKTAQTTGQRILLEVGGEWCIWCHYLENFINSHAEIKDSLYQNFIVVKVNYSKENKNEKFLSQYPKIPGYPHLFVLDTNGKFLHSQGTAELEMNRSYDPERVMEFINEWKPEKSPTNSGEHPE